jgi:hypothetical protein
MKAGYSWAFGLLLLIPVVNLIVLAMFAFETWPAQSLLNKNHDNPTQEKGTQEVKSTTSVKLKHAANFCSICGNKLVPGVNYCSNCGGKLGQTGISSTESFANEPSAKSKDEFECDVYCPYCNSFNTEQRLIEGFYNDTKASKGGYWAKWDCQCFDCRKTWIGKAYYHKIFK